MDDIFKKLLHISLSEKNGLVGMDSRLQKMDSLLCRGVNDVRFVENANSVSLGEKDFIYTNSEGSSTVICRYRNVKIKGNANYLSAKFATGNDRAISSQFLHKHKSKV